MIQIENMLRCGLFQIYDKTVLQKIVHIRIHYNSVSIDLRNLEQRAFQAFD